MAEHKANNTGPSEVARVYAMSRAKGHLIDCTRVEGTRAALLAEAGVILKGIKWPQANKEFPTFWKTAQFQCSLLCIETDEGGQPLWRLHLSPKDEALQAAVPAIMRTPSHHPEHAALVRAARYDKKFRAFMAAIPGMIPPTRGRKSKTDSSGATSHD